jgi:hypothetical protein
MEESEENVRRLGEFDLRRTDPFGFWIIEKKGKPAVEFLDKSFTSIQFAKNAINTLVANRKTADHKKG